VVARLSLDDLAGDFDFAKIGRAPAHFDDAELRTLNAGLLHQLPFAAVEGRLAAMDVQADPELWAAIQHNLTILGDAKALTRLVRGPVSPVIADAGFAAAAAQLLPPEPWGPDTWGAWAKAVSAQTGAKGRDLYHPLRLALTGQESGPEMKKLLPLIGRRRSLARLEGRPA
jgi:glutamyl-tRNA synthetase